MRRGRRIKGARVLGPYYDPKRERWQVIVIGTDGKRAVGTYQTEEEAIAVACEATENNPDVQITVGEAIDEYIFYLYDVRKSTQRKRRDRTVEKRESSLRMMLTGDMAIRRLSIPYLQQRINARLSCRAFDTVKGDWSVVKLFLRWAKRQGYLPSTVTMRLDEIVIEGKSSCGKPQLNLDESRLYVDAALAWDAELTHTCHGPLIALLPLLCGLRDREILDRTVRDLDDGGRLLNIEDGKTKNATRSIVLPTLLQSLIARWSHGKSRTELLFPGASGKPHYNSYIQDWVARVCQRAGVPRVCPHGLRGTFASLAENAGVPSLEVAAALGHADDTVTGKHYTLPSIRKSQQTQRRVERVQLLVIEGGQR